MFTNDDEKKSILSTAVHQGDVAKLRALILEGLIVSKEAFPSLLNVAASGGHVDMIELLIKEFHFDVNAEPIDAYCRPLEKALMNGHVAAAKKLIVAGAHVKLSFHQGQIRSVLRSLRLAQLSDEKFAEIYRFLFNIAELKKLVTNENDNAPFNEEMYKLDVDELLSEFADTPLYHAVSFCLLETTKVLLANGADFLFSNQLQNSRYPLLTAAIQERFNAPKSQKQQEEMVKFLLSLKDINGKALLPVVQKDYTGNTALEYAITLKLFGIVKMLVDADASYVDISVDNMNLIQHAYINSLYELFLTVIWKPRSPFRANTEYYFKDPRFTQFHIQLIEHFFSKTLSFETSAEEVGCGWGGEYLAKSLNESVMPKFLALKRVHAVKSLVDINEIAHLLTVCGGDYPLGLDEHDQRMMLFHFVYETIHAKFSQKEIDNLITQLVEQNKFNFRVKIPLINMIVLKKQYHSIHAELYNAFTAIFDEGILRLLTQLFQGFYNECETILLAEEANCFNDEPATVELSMSSLANLFKNEIHGLCTSTNVDPIGIPDWQIKDLHDLIKVKQQVTPNEVPKPQYLITKKPVELFLWLLHNIQLLKAQIIQKNSKLEIQLPRQPFVRSTYITEQVRSSVLAPDSPLCATRQEPPQLALIPTNCLSYNT